MKKMIVPFSERTECVYECVLIDEQIIYVLLWQIMSDLDFDSKPMFVFVFWAKPQKL